jgi:S-DNA-T family DNA segregation ATPase FtsK/SpoIIIE
MHWDDNQVEESPLESAWQRGRRDLLVLGHWALAIYVLIALASYDLHDGGWSHSSSGDAVRNAAGAVGAWIADLCFYLLGLVAYALPLAAAYQGYRIYCGLAGQAPQSLLWQRLRYGAIVLTVLAAAALVQMLWPHPRLALPGDSGGILGFALAQWLLGSFGHHGAKLLLLAGFLGGLTLAGGISWLAVIDAAGQAAINAGRYLARQWQRWRSARAAARAQQTDEDHSAVPFQAAAPMPFMAPLPEIPAAVPAAARPNNSTRTAPPPPPAAPARPAAAGVPAKPVSYAGVRAGELPGLDLLSDRSGRPKIRSYSEHDLQSMANRLEGILDDFGVKAEVMEIHPGPVITRFEINPAAGIKVSRITGLAKDLARALLVPSVRIVEIIPGKSFVGIEIPNQEREMVLLRDVLASSEYADAESPLTLVLGKDISGRPSVANLAKMPHLLVAGTTGSGKSVAVNVMILSMLYKATPDQVRLIMIDPKMLELSVYESIPHLLTPVVTDMKEAANSLRWSVAEMERRYKLMSKLGVRNIIGYNEKVAEAIANGRPIPDPLYQPNQILDYDAEPPTLEHLPYIVIVIDELADMMMIVGKKVEELIARLAQKARAAGLHLILATQRPSVDVLTGLIKANIPTRVAFQVSSKIDSRTIIDQGGAEALLGNGDMLFLPPGSGLPMRVHGAFVPDEEVHRVVEFLKRTGPANYLDDIVNYSAEGSENGSGSHSGGGNYSGEDGNAEGDALYDEAVRFVTESRKASISSVQRKLQIGYNRAARMIEQMEQTGIVGPAERNGNRTVLAPPPPTL